MSKRVVSLLAVIVLALAAFGATAWAQSSTYSAGLTGAAEVPGPGDTDGVGGAAVSFTSDTEIVYALDVSAITLPAAAAHIHRGTATESGPVVVPFDPPGADGKVSGTVTADAALVAEIKANPQNFYVNVHTSDFPAGAIRGQLAGDAPARMPDTGLSDSPTLWVAGGALLVLIAGLSLRRTTRRSAM